MVRVRRCLWRVGCSEGDGGDDNKGNEGMVDMGSVVAEEQKDKRTLMRQNYVFNDFFTPFP